MNTRTLESVSFRLFIAQCEVAKEDMRVALTTWRKVRNALGL